MTKKSLILPWTLAILLAAGMTGTFFAYRQEQQKVALTASAHSSRSAHSSGSALSSKNSPSSSSAAAVSGSGQSGATESSSPTGTDAQTSSQAEKNDIDLAAAQTQMLTSRYMQTYRLESETSTILPKTGRYVYLTFDDGPSYNTPGVLDILKKNNIKATFFVVYNKDKEYYKQIVAGGNTLALHTYTHIYSQVYASLNAYFKDLDRISDYVYSITGIRSKIVRLPGGGSNTISHHYCKGVMTAVTNALTQRGYSYYDWNAQCLDATTDNITPAQILHNVESFTEVGGQKKPFIILLMHNGTSETSTREALQSVIDYYRSEGYKFEQITPDTPAIHQIVQN